MATTDDFYLPLSSSDPPPEPPLKRILFALCLLLLGTFVIALGIATIIDKLVGNRVHGFYYVALGSVLFIPGFYYTRIAYCTWRGYHGFSYESIPPI